MLQVRDVVFSRDFYRDRLGFPDSSLWGEPPSFAIVGRDTITVFLDQTDPDMPIVPNKLWAAYLYIDDVCSLTDELKARGVDILRGPEDTPYGCREIEIRDPDGHVICFGQDIAPSGKGPGL